MIIKQRRNKNKVNIINIGEWNKEEQISKRSDKYDYV